MKFIPSLCLVAVVLFSSANIVFAAPCCSAGSAAPSLITGDDKAQMSMDVSGGYVVGDVGSQGPAVFRSSDNSETEGGVTLNGARLISDRWQLGASLPLRYRSHEQSGQEGSARGIGDFRFNLGYEILPEWSYSSWRPRGYVFAQQTFPTAKSIYDSSDPQAVDAFGKGFYATGFGVLFLKSWKYFDASWLSSAQYSFSRSFDGTEIIPGWAMQSSVGLGYSPARGPVRVGLRMSPQYQQPKKARSVSGESKSPSQLVWDTGFDIGVSTSDASTLTVSYTDQTLMGPAKNTTLTRTASVSFQYRWVR